MTIYACGGTATGRVVLSGLLRDHHRREGQEQNCAVTNNDIAPEDTTLKVIKTVVNDSGDIASLGGFTMKVTLPGGIFSFPGSRNQRSKACQEAVLLDNWALPQLAAPVLLPRADIWYILRQLD